MTTYTKNLRTAMLATVGLTVLVCGIYPFIVWGISQLAFKDKANGSLIAKDGKTIGSELIGQNFTSAQYFHSRPSAAGNGYDAANSGGSNLGPISGKLLNGLPDDPATKEDESFVGLRQRVEIYRQENGLESDVLIPADAVTASASGLDPHISPKNADLQVKRVAKARGVTEEAVKSLVQKFTKGRDLGVFGEPRVNVLKLNLALDESLR